MKNLKKISRNELKSVVGGIGTNDGLPFCIKPRQIELWKCNAALWIPNHVMQQVAE